MEKTAYKSISQRDIGIWIDAYDDIFSDFDSREYSERNISEDFLYEVKRVSMESEFHVNELKLFIAEKGRNPDTENIIAKRLYSHFKNGYHHSQQQKKEERKKGFLLLLAGSLMLLLAAFIVTINSDRIYFRSFFVILEPAGWFMSWTGLEKIFSAVRRANSDLDFYAKMSKCKIVFIDIEKHTDKGHPHT